jgi:hypothetical protein
MQTNVSTGVLDHSANSRKIPKGPDKIPFSPIESNIPPLKKYISHLWSSYEVL